MPGRYVIWRIYFNYSVLLSSYPSEPPLPISMHERKVVSTPMMIRNGAIKNIDALE